MKNDRLVNETNNESTRKDMNGLALETVVAEGGVTLQNIVDLALATRDNVRSHRKQTGFAPPEPEIEKDGEVMISFETMVSPDGFDILVDFDGIKVAGGYNSFRLDAEYPGGIILLGGSRGKDLKDEFFFWADPDGGEIGAFSSRKYADFEDVEGEVFTLHFEGPIAAARLVTFVDVAIQHGKLPLPIAANKRVKLHPELYEE